MTKSIIIMLNKFVRLKTNTYLNKLFSSENLYLKKTSIKNIKQPVFTDGVQEDILNNVM